MLPTILSSWYRSSSTAILTKPAVQQTPGVSIPFRARHLCPLSSEARWTEPIGEFVYFPKSSVMSETVAEATH